MPVNNEAFYSLLGIAMRAGILTFGEEQVIKEIRSGKCSLVLLDSAASENTKKKITDSCTSHNTRLLILQEERLSRSVGKPGRMSAAVNPGTLCERLCELSEEQKN